MIFSCKLLVDTGHSYISNKIQSSYYKDANGSQSSFNQEIAVSNIGLALFLFMDDNMWSSVMHRPISLNIIIPQYFNFFVFLHLFWDMLVPFISGINIHAQFPVNSPCLGVMSYTYKLATAT